MRTTATLKRDRAAHQRRLRDAVKRLVIELGYLEHCLERGLQDVHVQTAAASIDTAINCLNEHLAG
ncbi:hypothetical protein PN498_26850 [Oscillatoria sp. CS-180]|uniref:hypothetical protein n=1 Tax=Oscillatoria sp. CS-180 TaxID=3021720 RepID=UPI00232B0AAF|nr:hypothetical protein [Oscillatoria sp. CS-180]MDB9529638.1 hypothetical protein [Oscillatoria sp. CS-180]